MHHIFDNPGPHPLPTARCRLCRKWFDCFPRRRGENAEINSCFEDRRRIDLDVCQAHFQRLREVSGLPEAPYQYMERELLSQLCEAMEFYSNVLEFSFSLHGEGRSLYRFSYSYPHLTRHSLPHVHAMITACIRELAPDVEALLNRLLNPAHPPLVEQLLWGFDADPQHWRLKLYFQFPQGMEELKGLFLKHFLRDTVFPGSPASLEKLHLLGVDFSRDGIRGIKLYEMHEFLATDTLRPTFEKHPLLGALLDGPCAEGMHDVLFIRRIEAPGSQNMPEPSEVDFSLWKNGLTHEDLRRYLPSDAKRRLDDALCPLEGRHWSANRFSVALSDVEKMNLYYYLLDPPA